MRLRTEPLRVRSPAAWLTKDIMSMMSCEVRVTEGVLRGKECSGFDGTKYYSFEGIPYARPPVGDLRFRDPLPPEKWTGIRDCTKPGNKCAQINPISSKGFEGSEDCLYLNIYTPSLDSSNLPVLFFIHGGRLMIGYGDYYRPDYFMRHGVVLITINYRLNILGFLSLDIPEVPGNAGMKDCALALKWARKNVGSFSGDFKNITVFGESAGAALAASFLMSDMTVGLFDKVIAQSGNNVADVFFRKQDHIAVASHIASLLGKDLKDTRSLYEFFKAVPIEDLVQACTIADVTKTPTNISPILLPVVEKVFDGVARFLTEEPKVSLRCGRFAKVPMIAGSNNLEGAVFLRRDDSGILYENDFKYFVPPSLYLKETDPKAVKIARKIKQFYFDNKFIDDSFRTEYVKFLSEAYFMRDIILFAEAMAKNNNFYAYKFNFEGNLNISTMKDLELRGTTHGDSVQYQFYSKNKIKKCTERDKKIIDFFSEAWCNFARNGKPTWANQTVQWRPYTAEGKLTLAIDEEMRLVKNEDWPGFVFWQDICAEKAKL